MQLQLAVLLMSYFLFLGQRSGPAMGCDPSQMTEELRENLKSIKRKHIENQK